LINEINKTERGDVEISIFAHWGGQSYQKRADEKGFERIMGSRMQSIEITVWSWGGGTLFGCWSSGVYQHRAEKKKK
jgi:hypothetical protein